MRGIIGIGLLGTVLLTGCLFPNESFHKKELRWVTALASDNPGHSGDRSAAVDQTSKKSHLMFNGAYNKKSLVVRLDWDGRSAELGDGQPVWGDSPISVDLTTPMLVTIHGFDDSTVTYELTAGPFPPYIDNFRFMQADNPSLVGTAWGQAQYEVVPGAPGYQQVSSWQIELPNTAPDMLIPRFWTSWNRAFWQGQEVFSGVTPIDVSADDNLVIEAYSGETYQVPVHFRTPPLALQRVTLEIRDNPGLRKDSTAVIDHSTRTIYLAVPNYLSASSLVVRLTHTGVKTTLDGNDFVSVVTVGDLSQNHTVSVAGKGSDHLDYTLKTTAVAPSSSTKLGSLRFYQNYYQTPPYLPNAADSVNASLSHETQHSLDYSYQSYRSSNIHYLSIDSMDAIRVTTNGVELLSGDVLDGFYSPANWLDFSGPIDLVLTAEDLSTRSVTLTLDHP